MLGPDLGQGRSESCVARCVGSWSNVQQCLAGISKYWRSMCYATIEMLMDELSQMSDPNKVNERRNERDSRRPEITKSKLGTHSLN